MTPAKITVACGGVGHACMQINPGIDKRGGGGGGGGVGVQYV